MYIHAEKTAENKKTAEGDILGQKQKSNKPAVYLVDNRPSTVAQRKLLEGINSARIQILKTKKTDYSHEIQLKEKAPTYTGDTTQLANDGNSQKLARARYKFGGGKNAKKTPFSDWKRGREAQHLIPAQICDEFEIGEEWVNSPENGMMMPSGRTTTNHLRNKKLDKGKMHHIKGAGAHPKYNAQVRGVAKRKGWVKGNVTLKQFRILAKILRSRNRPKRTGRAAGFVDDMSL